MSFEGRPDDRAPGRTGPGAPDDRGLVLVDLLQPLGRLPGLARTAVAKGYWLDAYLVSAAAVQVTEDLMAGSARTGRRMWWRQLVEEMEAPGLTRRAVLRAARSALAGADLVSEATSTGRALASVSGALARLRDALAPPVVGQPGPDEAVLAALLEAAESGVASLPGGTRSEVLRLPSSFRSFDQHPEDVRELVRRAAGRWPDRSRPIVVVGVRTSGSYLAPLAAACLRAEGYAEVSVVTLRPGVAPPAAARSTLARVTAGPGLALLMDDPPVSGRSLARVASQLEGMGAGPSAVALLLALAGTAMVPAPALARYPAVVLPWDDWHVQRLLEPAQVAHAVEHLAGGSQVLSCLARQRVGDGRRHVQARYDIALLPPGSSVVEAMELVVEGTGSGMFGRHALAVSRAMGPAVEPVLGFGDGLVYMTEPPGGWQGADLDEPPVAREVAAYVDLRRRALGTEGDPTPAMGGRLPLWEAASRALAPLTGRPLPVLRMGLLAPLARRLLVTADASVIDGCMGNSLWYRDDEGRLVKRGAATGAFWHFDLACYDAAYDLAAAAVEADLAGLAKEAVAPGQAVPGHGAPEVVAPGAAGYAEAWAHRSGKAPDEGRWLLHRLVRLWDLERRGEVDEEMAARASSRAVNEFFAATFLSDLATVPLSGTVAPCALDLDGCLEGAVLGFSATTGTGAMALRALRAHGVPTLLATGRSVGEVVERCSAFGLPGGTAEYGAAAYRAVDGVVTPLVDGTGTSRLAQLRVQMGGTPGLELSPFHAYSVRVRRRGRGPGRAVGNELLGDLAGEWEVVRGENQTDMLLPGTEKAAGLRALVGTAGRQGTGGTEGTGRFLCLAVGDSRSDLGMLRAAAIAVAPANCSPALRHSGGVVVVGTGYQAGVAEGVGALLGHAPGSCPLCRAPGMGPEHRQLVALLSTHSSGSRHLRALVMELAQGWVGSPTRLLAGRSYRYWGEPRSRVRRGPVPAPRGAWRTSGTSGAGWY